MLKFLIVSNFPGTNPVRVTPGTGDFVEVDPATPTTNHQLLGILCEKG